MKLQHVSKVAIIAKPTIQALTTGLRDIATAPLAYLSLFLLPRTYFPQALGVLPTLLDPTTLGFLPSQSHFASLTSSKDYLSKRASIQWDAQPSIVEVGNILVISQNDERRPLQKGHALHRLGAVLER